MRILWLTLFLLGCSALAAQVLAHEFYDAWCCNGRDCMAYEGKVEVTAKGYYIPEFDQLIPFKDASGVNKYAEEAGTRYEVPDSGPKYAMCRLPYENKIRCFYAKPSGV